MSLCLPIYSLPVCLSHSPRFLRSSQVSIRSTGLTGSFAVNYRLGDARTHTYAPVHRLDAHVLTEYLRVQSQGLWELYSDMELNMIPVLAGEGHFTLLH